VGEASERLAQYGPNQLRAPERASVLSILIAQLRSVIVALLGAAFVVSLMFGDRAEALAIAAVIVINTVIGLVTELRARRAMEALLALDVVRAWVVREGVVHAVDARELVPGDVIEIEAERQVPADARLIEGSDLRVDEAVLTGESVPVEKTLDPLPPDTLLADRENCLYKGTVAIAGLGRAVVTATGAATEVGKIGRLVGEVRARRTPLEERLDVLGRRLVWLALGVAALVAALGALQGAPWLLLLQTAIALAVAAVPEALPAVATIALAVGMARMARRHALVRRLPAVEALGSTTVICTDKTRTLTSGRMTVVRLAAAGVDLGGPFDDAPAMPAPILRLLTAAAHASRRHDGADDATRATEEPEDLAVLDAAAEAGLDHHALNGPGLQVTVLPFSSLRRYMAAFLADQGETIAYVKGAPRAVIDLSRDVLTAEGVVPFDDRQRDAALAVNETLAGAGLRVLAVASGRVENASDRAVRDLTFLGFVGLADPPAPGVKDTIARLGGAGLQTVMLTGDQRLTAEAIGRQLGLLDAGDRAIDGRDFEAASAEARADLIARTRAFSRISPEHKLIVVQALQARGEIVSMIGDGVNDAPALAQADIGVAMGQRGTDAAKQAAAIVLLDDRFDTIAAAVEEGRVIFDNIRKFVFYLFSCNVAEVLVLLVAGVAGLPLPLLPLQILWLNLVTDTFPALALAVEPAGDDVMHRPPRRPDDVILSRTFLKNVLVFGGLITAVTLGAFVWALERGPAHASTVAFMTLSFAQTLHLGYARSAGLGLRPAPVFGNWFAIGGVALAAGLQVMAALVPPLARLLHLTPLAWLDWIVIVALSAVPAVAGLAANFLVPPARADAAR
jgi:Ca2+-transporting ATPase